MRTFRLSSPQRKGSYGGVEFAYVLDQANYEGLTDYDISDSDGKIIRIVRDGRVVTRTTSLSNSLGRIANALERVNDQTTEIERRTKSEQETNWLLQMYRKPVGFIRETARDYPDMSKIPQWKWDFLVAVCDELGQYTWPREATAEDLGLA